MFYLYFFVLISVIIVIYSFLTNTFNYWKKKNVEGPTPVIWVGNFPSILKKNIHPIYEYDRIYNKYKKNEAFVGIYTMKTPKLMLIDPDLIRDVMVKHFRYFSDNEISDFVHKKSDPLLGRSPFFMKGLGWKNSRSNIAPALSNSRIRTIFSQIDNTCTQMTDYIKLKNGPINAFDFVTRYTVDIVSAAAFGVDGGCFTSEDGSEIMKMAAGLFQFSPKFKFYQTMSSLFPSVSRMFNVSMVQKNVNEFFINLMRNALNYRKSNNIQQHDFLDVLLKLEGNKELDILSLTAYGVSIVFDGYDTSSIIMVNCLYELAKNTAAQEKLRVELNNAENLTFENISKLQYLESVFCENIRLHPILTVITRKCTESIQLVAKNGQKVFVEKDRTIVIPFYSIHTDERYYENPFSFDPDRFNTENGGTKPYTDKSVYIPFGDGPRKCLGMRFGTAQIKRGICEIIKNFEISLNPQTIEPVNFLSGNMLINIPENVWLNFKKI